MAFKFDTLGVQLSTDGNHFRQQTILVIDDDSQMRALLDQALRISGFNVATAQGADDGIELLSVLKPDLVIIDLRLQGRSGWHIHQVLRTDLHDAFTPVIFLSGVVAKESESVTDRLSLNCVMMAKPFEVPRLIKTVNRLLSHKAERQEKVRNNAREEALVGAA